MKNFIKICVIIISIGFLESCNSINLKKAERKSNDSIIKTGIDNIGLNVSYRDLFITKLENDAIRNDINISLNKNQIKQLFKNIEILSALNLNQQKNIICLKNEILELKKEIVSLQGVLESIVQKCNENFNNIVEGINKIQKKKN